MNTVLATQSPATEPQINELHRLFNVKFDADKAAELHEWLNTHRLSKATASNRIGKLYAMPDVNELDEGMYRVGEDIFKVYRTRDKNILVTKQLGEDGFEYTGKKPLSFITAEHRMTLDEAKEYGKVTGICCVCGAKLTNEKSIANGIGPVCGGRV